MKRWHIVFDVNKCIGCYTCMLACKDEHVGNEWLPYTDRQKKKDQKWINMGRKERGIVPRVDLAYRPTLCNHCENTPCAKNAPGAIIKRSDGIILLDPRKAAGNKALVDACPYGSISWNDEVGAAQKCTMCAHLIDDGWKEPRCVQSCPLKALKAIKMEDAEFEKLAKEKGLVTVAPEAAGPRVYYKNLHRFNKCMITGEVAYYEGDTDVCAEKVEVCLKKNGEVIDKKETSTFGEFMFDKIEPNSGEYEVEAEMLSKGKASVTVKIDADSADTGVIYLK